MTWGGKENGVRGGDYTKRSMPPQQYVDQSVRWLSLWSLCLPIESIGGSDT